MLSAGTTPVRTIRQILGIEACQRSGNAFQALFDRLGRAANADAEMLRRFEEVAGHDAGFEFVAKQIAKLLCVSAAEAGRDGGTEPARFGLEIFAVRREERVEESTVALQQSARAFGEAREMIERDDAKTLGTMRRDAVGKIDNVAHAADKIRLRQDPTTAKTAQSISFR